MERCSSSDTLDLSKPISFSLTSLFGLPPQHDHTIAAAVRTMGVLGMLLAFAWGGYILYLQYRSLRDSSTDA